MKKVRTKSAANKDLRVIGLGELCDSAIACAERASLRRDEIPTEGGAIDADAADQCQRELVATRFALRMLRDQLAKLEA